MSHPWLDIAVEREQLLIDNGFVAAWPLYNRGDVSIRAVELVSNTDEEWNKFLTNNNINTNQ